MATGIPGPLPKSARKFYVTPHFYGRRTYFHVESDIDVDVGPSGKRRVFWNIERAQQRADELNADHQQNAAQGGGD